MSWQLLSVESFNQYRREWDNLNLSSARSPVLETRFIKPLLNEFGTGAEYLAIFGAKNDPDAIVLLQYGRRGYWETFQPSQAPLGAFMRKKGTDICTLLASLVRVLPGYALGIGITQQDPDIEPRPNKNKNTSTLDYIQTARITIDSNFDQYWAARGKNLRQNLKRQRNRIMREGIETRLETINDPKDVAQAIVDYGNLESSGWKAQFGTAIHADNAQGRCYRAILEDYCISGDGRIYKYWYNNNLVAVDLCITGNDCLVILKTTYDETQKTSSPTLLMRQDSFRELFRRREFKRIEFYGKVMDWHTKWTDEIRLMFHINYYRWPIFPLIRRLAKLK